ncbi:hypothetical protein B0H19DRAFT_124568 [Mycena capillaripes]|nr:hypothetical protein B0H19DRAFT_124568 [Mycena capillaripes]
MFLLKIGSSLPLLASFLLYSLRVNADLIPRGPTVCLHCPAFPRLTLTEDDEPAGYIDCLYSDDFTQCVYFPSDGALITSDSTPNCPAYCCAVGYTFTSHTIGCVPTVVCSAGQYRDANTNTCVGCASGTYSVDGSGISCTSCPNEATSPPNSVSANACTCTAGTFVSGNSCDTCAPGTYSGAAATSCSLCPANTFSGAGASSCTTCPSSAISDPGSSACTLNCPSGQFVQGNSCSTCAAGAYSAGGAVTSCNQCDANTFSAAGSGSCSACPSGTTSDPGSSDLRRGDVQRAE